MIYCPRSNASRADVAGYSVPGQQQTCRPVGSISALGRCGPHTLPLRFSGRGKFSLGRFRSKKPLCCSHFSNNSLSKLTGKIFRRTGNWVSVNSRGPQPIIVHSDELLRAGSSSAMARQAAPSRDHDPPSSPVAVLVLEPSGYSCLLVLFKNDQHSLLRVPSPRRLDHWSWVITIRFRLIGRAPVAAKFSMSSIAKACPS